MIQYVPESQHSWLTANTRDLVGLNPPPTTAGWPLPKCLIPGNLCRKVEVSLWSMWLKLVVLVVVFLKKMDLKKMFMNWRFRSLWVCWGIFVLQRKKNPLMCVCERKFAFISGWNMEESLNLFLKQKDWKEFLWLFPLWWSSLNCSSNNSYRSWWLNWAGQEA